MVTQSIKPKPNKLTDREYADSHNGTVPRFQAFIPGPGHVTRFHLSALQVQGFWLIQTSSQN